MADAPLVIGGIVLVPAGLAGVIVPRQPGVLFRSVWSTRRPRRIP